MKYFADVIKIIDGGLKGDKKKVLDYSILLAEKLQNDGELDKSNRIRKIMNKNYFNEDLEANVVSGTYMAYPKQIPFDQESKLELADIIMPEQIEDKKLFLINENEQQINDFIESYKKADLFSTRGLDVSTSLLFFGPPGCGKTQTALFIAKRLSLPIIIARIDTLISSYLGSTSKNIRMLFDYASKAPCILFLDEFDAVAKLRDDQHEMGELKRVVNSLLQNIDALGDKSILIAATNHERLLDSAIWRRFNNRIHISLPNKSLIREVILSMITEFSLNLEDKYVNFLSELYYGQSIADIEQIVKRGIRKAILEDRNVEISDLTEVYFSYARLEIDMTGDVNVIRRNKIKYLLDHVSKVSDRFLGEIFKCHHATISNDIKKIKEENRKEVVING